MKKIPILIILFFPLFITAQTWQQIGPEGGYFKEFAFHPSNSSIVYAGSDDGGGVWKSVDNGASWTLLTANFPNMTAWSISIDQNFPDTLYVCDVYGRYGVLKSTDGGANWVQKASGLTSRYDKMISGLAIKTSDTLFISTGESASTTPPRPGNGVFKSYDGGDTWIPTGLQGITTPCIGSNVFGTIFIGTESNGLYYSNNNGVNWIVHPDINAASTVHEIDTKDSVIVLATSTGVYLSTNWGINFTNIGLSGDINFDISIHQTFPNIELFCSTFAGLQFYSSLSTTWNVVSDPLLTNQLVIGLLSDGTNVYIGTFSNSPMIKSNDGGSSWNTTTTSPIATELNDIYIDPLNSNRILTCLLGTYNLGGNYNRECIYETTNGGVSWVRKGPEAHGLCLTVNPQNSNQFYLGTFSQGLFKTNNNFNTYTNLISGNKLIGDVAVSRTDTDVVIISQVDLDASQVSIRRSTDGGNNFSNVASLVTNRILFNPNNNDTVYAATNNGIHLSIDNGVSWNSWVLSGSNIFSLAYKNNTLYAGTDQGILYKIENSIPTNISGNWPTPIQIKSIYILNQDIFIGMNGAEQDTVYNLQGSVWKSSNNGVSWNDITTQMTATNVYGNNIIDSDGSELFVGTYGGGVFKSSGLALSLDENEINYSTIVYPNPTTNLLNLYSSHRNITAIKVMNSLGQDVSNQVKKRYVGNTKMIIDLTGLSAGMYFVSTYSNEKIISTNKIYKQ